MQNPFLTSTGDEEGDYSRDGGVEESRPSGPTGSKMMNDSLWEYANGPNPNWTADLSTFPSEVDKRCLAEIVFGRRAGAVLKAYILLNPRTFIVVGCVLHLFGLGSMSQLFERRSKHGEDGHVASIDYVWTVLMPFCCVWYLLTFGVCTYGFLKIMSRMFKPLYILGNAALFSFATFNYFFKARGYLELSGKFFDVCAFTCIALSDAIPHPLRRPFHQSFLPTFVLLYALVILPRLYGSVDVEGNVQCINFGSEKLCNTTVACQVLINLLIWITYISVNSFLHPDSFHLLLARVQERDSFRTSVSTNA